MAEIYKIIVINIFIFCRYFDFIFLGWLFSYFILFGIFINYDK